jgi:Na+-driven multidrug efflux pump
MENIVPDSQDDSQSPLTSSLFSGQSLLDKSDSESSIFQSRSLLWRLVYLSIGPLTTPIVIGINGLADSFWVSRTIGHEAIAVFGAVCIIEFIAVAISQYLLTSLAARAAFLFGNQDESAIPQMFIDFLRIALIIGILLPFAILPATRPILEWFGAATPFAHDCLLYMVPGTSASLFMFAYMLVCGQAQAEGKSIEFGLFQVGSLVMNQLVFNPVFLMGLRLPVWGVSLSRACTGAVVAAIGLGLIFGGYFKIHPTLQMFSKPFVEETWVAMRVGFAEFIGVISESLPMIVMQKFVNSAALEIGEYETILEVWNLIEKLAEMGCGICGGLSLGFLPSAAHSFGAHRPRECIWSSIHTFWLGTLIAALLSYVIAFLPVQTASIWSTDKHFLEWARKMIPIVFYGGPAWGMQFMVPTLYEAMQRSAASTLIALVTEFFPVPIFSCILHFTGPSDPVRVLWAYFFTDIFSFLVCGCFYLPVLFRFLRAPEDSPASPGAKENDERICYTV